MKSSGKPLDYIGLALTCLKASELDFPRRIK
jgi:hypothetical protein